MKTKGHVVALSLLAASALLASCGKSASPIADTAAASGRRASTSVAARPAGEHRDHGPSWISPALGKSSGQLLFVSDSGTDDVYIYTIPALQLVGTVTGFNQPQGECADSSGHIWVTDTNAQTIYELSRQGSLEKRLNDKTGYPVGCAWDATTGNLAVTNLFALDGSAGAVLIYRHASGSPKTFVNPDTYYYYFAGFDPKGDLFFDGRASGGAFALSELVKGGSSAKTVPVAGGSIYFPGMVQWNAAKGQLIVGDQNCEASFAACVYRLAIGANAAHVKGVTSLKNADGGDVCDLVEGVQAGNRIVGSDYEFCGYRSSATNVWPYPGGGPPSSHYDRGESVPVGAAISNQYRRFVQR